MSEFSRILDARLRETKRSSKWLADQIGRAASTVWNWRQGKGEPGISLSKTIADIVGFDIKDCLTEEEVKDIEASERREEILKDRKEEIAVLPLFPAGADLLRSLKQSVQGYSIDATMSKEKFGLIPGLIAHEGDFAVRADGLIDCDEVCDFIVISPWTGSIEPEKTLFFTTDPPCGFYVRRVIMQETDRFILQSEYDGKKIIGDSDIVPLGVVKCIVILK